MLEKPRNFPSDICKSKFEIVYLTVVCESRLMFVLGFEKSVIF